MIKLALTVGATLFVFAAEVVLLSLVRFVVGLPFAWAKKRAQK